MASPAAFSSCLGPNGKSYVFYVNKHGFIKQWQQRNDLEILNAEGRNEYNDVETKIGNNTIKTSSKDLAALYIERVIDGKIQIHIRLYYANESNKLCELCYDIDKNTMQATKKSEGGWYSGALTDQGWKTQKDTPISAHFNSDPRDNSIKVYFLRDDARPGDRPTLAWYTVKDNGKWKLLDEDYEI